MYHIYAQNFCTCKLLLFIRIEKLITLTVSKIKKYLTLQHKTTKINQQISFFKYVITSPQNLSDFDSALKTNYKTFFLQNLCIFSSFYFFKLKLILFSTIFLENAQMNNTDLWFWWWINRAFNRISSYYMRRDW